MKRRIVMTMEQANLLNCYILMSISFREEEAEAWYRLSLEKDENGNPKFENAESNARWWGSLSDRLDKIYDVIDKSEVIFEEEDNIQ